MLRIDHVVYGVRDLDAAAARLWRDHGLGSAAGGRHPGQGTANRIVPLGDSYIELMAVVEPAETLESTFGRWVEVAVAGGDQLIGWGMATDDLDGVASRLDLTVASGSRDRPDGAVLTWRMAGIEKTMADPSLPFFITWDVPPELHPGRMEVEHRVRAQGISWVDVCAPRVKLDDWLGGEEVPVRIEDHGTPALRSVGIGTDEGEIILR
jgi:hypothetical protein